MARAILRTDASTSVIKRVRPQPHHKHGTMECYIELVTPSGYTTRVACNNQDEADYLIGALEWWLEAVKVLDEERPWTLQGIVTYYYSMAQRRKVA